MSVIHEPCADNPMPCWFMQVRDVDLDTLERVTSIIAFGDIEAEDTRHLTELNFIKVGGLSRGSRGFINVEFITKGRACLTIRLNQAVHFHSALV